MSSGWFARLFESGPAPGSPDRGTGERAPERHEAATGLLEPATGHGEPIGLSATTLPRAIREELLALAREAEENVAGGTPETEAAWTGRAAQIFAEAGATDHALALLERSFRLAAEVRDPGIAGVTSSGVAAAQCAAACALGDETLYWNGIERIQRLAEHALRARAFSRVYDDLEERGYEEAARRIGRRVLAEISSLEPFSFTLTASDVVPILARWTAARSDVIGLLAEASRRARDDDVLAETNVRAVGILFARVARELDDEVLLGRAAEIAASLKSPGSRAAVYGQIAVGWAEMGDAGEARKALELQYAAVSRMDEGWERRAAHWSTIEAALVVATATGDEALKARVERHIRQVGLEDRPLAIPAVCAALARYAARRRDPGAIRRAVRCACDEACGSTRYAEVALLARTLVDCGLEEEARSFLRGARDYSRSAHDPADRCRTVMGVAEAVLRTRIDVGEGRPAAR